MVGYAPFGTFRGASRVTTDRALAHDSFAVVPTHHVLPPTAREPQFARIVAGENVVDRQLIDSLLEQRPAGPTDELSSRELEVLGLMAEGLTDRSIAERLWLSEKTVETHVRHILRKLDLPTGVPYNRRVQAVLIFLDRA